MFVGLRSGPSGTVGIHRVVVVGQWRVRSTASRLEPIVSSGSSDVEPGTTGQEFDYRTGLYDDVGALLGEKTRSGAIDASL